MMIIHHNHQIAVEMKEELNDIGEQLGKVVETPQDFQPDQIEFEVMRGTIPVLKDYE